MAARMAAARTTTKNHGSAPRAEGARVAAARIRRMAASDTGAGRKRRSARCVSTTVKKSSGAPTLHRSGAGRDEEPGDEDEADALAGVPAEAFAQRAGLARGVSVSPGRLRPTVETILARAPACRRAWPRSASRGSVAERHGVPSRL